MEMSFLLNLETKSMDYTPESSKMELVISIIGVFVIDKETQNVMRGNFFQIASTLGGALYHMAYNRGVPHTVRQGWPVSESLELENFSSDRKVIYRCTARLIRNTEDTDLENLGLESVKLDYTEEILFVEITVELTATVPLPNLTAGDIALSSKDLLAVVFAISTLEAMFLRYFGMRIDVQFLGFDEESEPIFTFVLASNEEDEE